LVALVKRVLMIAFHYPPASISSGIQRTLKFSAYLPEMGWQPSVLTVNPRAHEHQSQEQLGEIPESVVVRRAFALDTARHLSFRGRYPLMLALPDKWASWWLGGVISGLAMIRKIRPQVIWSTYPIATAQWIGFTLHRLTGVPWVADLRDSMTEQNYPTNETVRSKYLWIEHKVVEHATKVVFTTPGTLDMYRARYPAVPAKRFAVIQNGYDEENFRSATARPATRDAARTITLVHSGILYPSERDPTQFFDAIAELKSAGNINASRLRVVLRGTRYDSTFRPELERRDIADIVRLDPPVGYEAALAEMLSADGLLIFQASNCNHQIPAKLYEYFRARRPVLGLTDPIGDTASEMRAAGLSAIAPLDDRAKIASVLLDFIAGIESRTAEVATDDAVVSASRRTRTVELAHLLDSVAVWS
jgi:glycosyltransferase involved in cell wall biosynthesis